MKQSDIDARRSQRGNPRLGSPIPVPMRSLFLSDSLSGLIAWFEQHGGPGVMTTDGEFFWILKNAEKVPVGPLLVDNTVHDASWHDGLSREFATLLADTDYDYDGIGRPQIRDHWTIEGFREGRALYERSFLNSGASGCIVTLRVVLTTKDYDFEAESLVELNHECQRRAKEKLKAAERAYGQHLVGKAAEQGRAIGDSSPSGLVDPPVLNEYAFLLNCAINIFGVLEEKNGKVSFDRWTEAFCAPDGEANDLGRYPTPERLKTSIEDLDLLKWLWRSLLSIPGEGDRSRRSVEVIRGVKHEIVVFDGPNEFVIILAVRAGHELNRVGLYAEDGKKQVVLVRTLGPLKMRTGKNGHLECCGVPADVWIPVDHSRVVEVERALIGEERKDIEIFAHAIRVRVSSLNEAYTVASRRLEPNRMTSGGNIYQHVAWTDRSRWITIKAIRKAVHMGRWNGPQATVGIHATPLDGVDTVGIDDPAWPCRRDGSVHKSAWDAWFKRQQDPLRSASPAAPNDNPSRDAMPSSAINKGMRLRYSSGAEALVLRRNRDGSLYVRAQVLDTDSFEEGEMMASSFVQVRRANGQWVDIALSQKEQQQAQWTRELLTGGR